MATRDSALGAALEAGVGVLAAGGFEAVFFAVVFFAVAVVAAVAFFGAAVVFAAVAVFFAVVFFAVVFFAVVFAAEVPVAAVAADFFRVVAFCGFSSDFTAFAASAGACSPTAESRPALTRSAPLSCALTGVLDTRPD
ncbi:hypothetical protein A6A06_21460 [Streptomyces sp. CB02923]|nr:hypothetical protein A6A06_21460 [Streptomyces sp. CB02923]